MRRMMDRLQAAILGVVALTLLAACSGAAEPTATVAPPTTAPTAAPTIAPTVAPTATAIPPTPTPLPTATSAPTAATPALTTATALSATSTAFVSTITAGTPTVPVATSDPKAQAVVDKARARLDQVNTTHLVLNVEGDLYIDDFRSQRLRSAEGDLVRPDRVSVAAKLSVGPINATIKFIQIGTDAYITNILSGKWEPAPSGFAYDPRIIFDRDRGASAILGNVRGWQFVENTKVNGIDTQHVRGPVPVQSVGALVGGALRGDMVDVDLYVEMKSNDIVRFVIAEQPAAAVAPSPVAARWTLDLSKQNEKITIDAPRVGS